MSPDQAALGDGASCSIHRLVAPVSRGAETLVPSSLRSVDLHDRAIHVADVFFTSSVLGVLGGYVRLLP
jgi:hypothetical protein